MNKLKIGTVFSGIGAIEHALKRMNIPYDIEFACDTGDVDIFSRKMKGTYEDTNIAFKEILEELKHFNRETNEDKEFFIKLKNEVTFLWNSFSELSNTATKSDLKKINEMLSMCFEKLHTQQSRIKVRNIKNYEDKKKYVDDLYKSKEKNNKVKQTYMANYSITDKEWNYNVCLLDGTQWKNKIDIFMGGSPCFTEDTLVLTKKGYKKIIDINLNDDVLSHDNKYHKVLNVMNKGYKKIYKMKAIGFHEINTTINHKFYVKRKGENPEWKTISELLNNFKEYYVGISINQNSEMPKFKRSELYIPYMKKFIDLNDKNWWFTAGHYLGDNSKYLINNFLKRFLLNGKKVVPGFIFDMPIIFLKEFLKGYLCSDENISNNIDDYCIKTKNKNIAYGICEIIAKVYHYIPKMKYENGFYFLIKADNCFYEDDIVWYPIESLESLNEEQKVFDIEVEDSHSFLANNCIVHNCQSFSAVGKRRGLEDTRGTLFFEFARLISEIKPKIFLYENVKGLLNHDKGKTWEIIQNVFNDLGYTYYYQILDAKDYGIPQNRKRIFVVGFRNDLNLKQNFKFPEKIPLNLKMQDFLLDNVSGRYYLTKNQVKFVNNEERIQKGYVSIDADIALCQLKHQQFNLAGNFVFVEDNKNMEKKMQDLDKYFLSEKLIRYVMDEKDIFWVNPETDKEIASTLLKTMHKMHRAGVDNYVHTEGRLRKLTPRECFRLMGFCDSFIIPVSDTSAYMQAGNSIVVDVLIHLLNEILKCYEF